MKKRKREEERRCGREGEKKERKRYNERRILRKRKREN